MPSLVFDKSPDNACSKFTHSLDKFAQLLVVRIFFTALPNPSLDLIDVLEQLKFQIVFHRIKKFQHFLLGGLTQNFKLKFKMVT